MKQRPTWDEYFMEIAGLVAQRSTCQRRNVGAVLVRDRRILASGYNGAPSGMEHCTLQGCLREQMDIPSGERYELCRSVHAEQNAIIQAAKHGISIEGATLYCTHAPCLICAKMLVQAGIRKAFYLEGHEDSRAFEVLGKELEIKRLGDD